MKRDMERGQLFLNNFIVIPLRDGDSVTFFGDSVTLITWLEIGVE